MMARAISSKAEEIIDKEFPVLDKGFVRLVDYMGSDQRIVQAARVSYGNGTKSVREDDSLIDYLLRNQHTSPFEQVSLTFHCKMPIFVARQWVRHRTAKLNEISGRYSVMKDEFYVPKSSDISLQSTDNKQGRAPDPLPAGKASSIIDKFRAGQRQAYDEYLGLVNGEGLARELARINLPVSLYTEWYWTIDLHNLFHFLALRLDAHAQKEIREYAQVMLMMARAVAPAATASFEKHTMNGVSFNEEELEVLRQVWGKMDSISLMEIASDKLKGKALDRLITKILEGRQT